MIRRATTSDLAQIHALNIEYALESMPEAFINNRDICLVAEDAGKIVGYIWAGLMARNTFAYVCGFVVRPDYSKSGTGQKLALELLRIARMKGVQSFVAAVRQNEYHDACAVTALKCGTSAAKETCTLLMGNTAHMAASLKELESGWRLRA